ncbi:MAG: sigma-70 family RNA polymerase sigma factor [Planctomycetota bacterium]
MFPTTIWTTILQAGNDDSAALERFARRYRAPILAAIRGRGWSDTDAEDICQDVFVRLLHGNVLARAEAAKGRFRGLLLGVTRHVILDRVRKKQLPTVGDADVATASAEIDDSPELAGWEAQFDEAWALALAERAMARLRDQRSPYFDVLVDRLDGRDHDRNKLWIARKKLSELVRAEVAETCATPDQFEEEMARLAPYLLR